MDTFLSVLFFLACIFSVKHFIVMQYNRQAKKFNGNKNQD